MKNYAFVEGKKIKSAKFHWDLGFSLKNGTKPEKIKKTPKYAAAQPFRHLMQQVQQLGSRARYR
ncbi:MAG: hypothetical protein EHM20_10930 [Alphaproteobacteria bacterium]|nr:MAG: hypothetical protein EHM20_10930 [Alphaproteobacteria bacterium]